MDTLGTEAHDLCTDLVSRQSLCFPRCGPPFTSEMHLCEVEDAFTTLSCLVSPRTSCSWAPTSSTREFEGKEKGGAWRPQLVQQVTFPDAQHIPGDSGRMKSLLVSAWRGGLLASAPTFLFNKGTTPSNSGLCTFPGWTILHTSLYYLYLREGNLVIHHRSPCLTECWHLAGTQ